MTGAEPFGAGAADAGPTVYGIANCDTVRRARAWLADRGVPARFHDFAQAGVPQDRLDAWLAGAGWERLLNRRGTTWRGLPEATRIAVVDAAAARAVMLAHASVIKRPVVEWPGGALTVGFDADEFARHA